MAQIDTDEERALSLAAEADRFVLKKAEKEPEALLMLMKEHEALVRLFLKEAIRENGILREWLGMSSHGDTENTEKGNH